jgi:hypothetical protein
MVGCSSDIMFREHTEDVLVGQGWSIGICSALNIDIDIIKLTQTPQLGVWSSGMILASGARGREFDSRNTPFLLFFRIFPIFSQFLHMILCLYLATHSCITMCIKRYTRRGQLRFLHIKHLDNPNVLQQYNHPPHSRAASPNP